MFLIQVSIWWNLNKQKRWKFELFRFVVSFFSTRWQCVTASAGVCGFKSAAAFMTRCCSATIRSPCVSLQSFGMFVFSTFIYQRRRKTPTKQQFQGWKEPHALFTLRQRDLRRSRACPGRSLWFQSRWLHPSPGRACGNPSEGEDSGVNRFT